MFNKPDREQVLALAGVFQAAMLVHQLAHKGTCNDEALVASAQSVLHLEVDSVIEVYGSIKNLRLGCGVIDQVFTGKLGSASKDIFQYSVAMHQLALKLDNTHHISKTIQDRVLELVQQYDFHSHDANEETLATLYEEVATLYARTLSTMEPRIIVRGSQGKLSNPITVNQVRSALFAGVRAAYLWNQLGGRRWQLLIYRSIFQKTAARLA